jgi:hypothetical protein
MQLLNELTDKNFLIYAAKHYNNPSCTDVKEFETDVAHLKYVKKLLKKYAERGILQERLILNHLIIFHNSFYPEAATAMCFHRIDQKYWPALKTFLLYLNYIPYGEYINIPIDLNIARTLQKI